MEYDCCKILTFICEMLKYLEVSSSKLKILYVNSREISKSKTKCTNKPTEKIT